MATHPTAVPVKAGEQLVAHLCLVNGHSWQVVLQARDALFADDEDTLDELEDEINLGNGSDPEEAIAQAVEDLREMADALEEHAKGLNERVRAYKAAKKA